MDWRTRWWNFKWYISRPPLRYAVITKLPAVGDGNEYDEFLAPRRTKTGWSKDGDTYEDVLHIANLNEIRLEAAVRARLPVFELGEILIVNRYGREVAARGRKPDKWCVECEYFWTRRAAIKRAKEVQDGSQEG